eukprot:3731276-Amphidinium_carterae.1
MQTQLILQRKSAWQTEEQERVDRLAAAREESSASKNTTIRSVSLKVRAHAYICEATAVTQCKRTEP